jgi:hypothetical protein
VGKKYKINDTITNPIIYSCFMFYIVIENIKKVKHFVEAPNIAAHEII